MERLVLNMNEEVEIVEQGKVDFFEIKEEVNLWLSAEFDLEVINRGAKLEKAIKDLEMAITSIEYIENREIGGKNDKRTFTKMKDIFEDELKMWTKIYTNSDEEFKEEAIELILDKYTDRQLGQKDQFELLQMIRIIFERTKHKLGLKKATSLCRWLNFLDVAYYHMDEVDGWKTLVIPSKCNNEEECEKCHCNGFCPRGY